MAQWLYDSMTKRGAATAVAGPWGTTSYADLIPRIDAWKTVLADVEPGRVVAFDGDYSPGSISLLLALALNRNVAVPLSRDVAANHESFVALAEAEYWITSVDSEPIVKVTGNNAVHPLYAELRERNAPGLILFSSGSTGAHKCALHDLSTLLKKFATPRHSYRTLVFLQLDHIGGVNTLFYTLANGGTGIVSDGRSAEAVCRAIAEHRGELLPTSPTFLNLLLLSEEYSRHDLSSLQLITYGTEPMPETTLRRVAQAFPNVKLLQTYGLSELGILRSQSRSSDSGWYVLGWGGGWGVWGSRRRWSTVDSGCAPNPRCSDTSTRRARSTAKDSSIPGTWSTSTASGSAFADARARSSTSVAARSTRRKSRASSSSSTTSRTLP
jgi:long-chain acyl-CoA synthetase